MMSQNIFLYRNGDRSQTTVEIREYNRSQVQIRFVKNKPTFILYDDINNDRNTIQKQKWSRIEDNKARVLTALVYFLFWLKWEG